MTEISIIKDGKIIDHYSSTAEDGLADVIGMTEQRPKGMDNNLLKVAFQDYSYSKYSIQVEQFNAQEDCRFTTKCEVKPIMAFCLLTQGNFSAKTSLFKNPEFEWEVGSANLVFRNGMGAMDMNLPKSETVEMVSFIIPQTFIEKLIAKEPNVFEKLDRYTQHIENTTIFPENHVVSKSVMQAANDIKKCRMMGNSASYYLESKFADCISGLLLPEQYKDGSLNISLAIRDKMHDAKDLILTHYQAMPSLHDLATMVGTNECTLKKAFKQEFGSTVFQYLFDYRMSLASQYLLDTTIPIADIGIKLGYDYQSHFCTAFKRKFGVSPMEYRQKKTMV